MKETNKKNSLSTGMIGMTTQIREINKLTEQVRLKTIDSLKEAAKNTKDLEYAAALNNMIKDINEESTNMVSTYIDKFKNNIKLANYTAMITKKALSEVDNLYSTKSLIVLERLLSIGWYPSLSFDNNELFKLSLYDNRMLEKYMINYTESSIEKIKENIIKSFPTRKHILEDCFEAHFKKQYTLSIPVMLVQTDGICKEIFEDNFFLTKINKTEEKRFPRVSESSVKDEAKFSSKAKEILYINPLTRFSSISQSEHNDFEYLNRHTVIHGNNTSYNTKENSYKTIMLLNYFSDWKTYLQSYSE